MNYHTAFTEWLVVLKQGLREHWFSGLLFMTVINGWVIYEQVIRPKEYVATLELYPPAFSTLGALNWNPKQFASYHIGAHQDFEKTLVFMRSDSVFKRVCNRFNLPQRYESDKPEQTKRLKNTYNSRIQITNQKRAFIQITVYETDADLARRIADTLRVIAQQFYDRLANRRLMLAELNTSLIFLEQHQRQVNTNAAEIRTKHGVYLLNRLNENASLALGTHRIFEPEFIRYYDKLLALEYQAFRLSKKLSETQQRISHLRTHFGTYTTLCSSSSQASVEVAANVPNRLGTIMWYLGLSFLGLVSWLGLCAALKHVSNA